MARRKQEECELNMTPMIDVVFQLIIFFVVTMNMSEAKNEDIKLAMAPHGPEIMADDPSSSLAMVIEVDKKGKITMAGRGVRIGDLKTMIQRRYNKYGVFPVMIRADQNARHKHVRQVMDLCTACGLARVSFVAIKEKHEND